MDAALATVIRKNEGESRASNMPDYAAARAGFGWDTARARLRGLPGGGLNIACEAVDRYVEDGAGSQLAIRWIAKDLQRRDFTYADLAAASSRFANVLQTNGIARAEAVFSLLGRVPELHVAAPPTPKTEARISPAARKLVAERGVDPSAISGTGPHGAILLEDVQAALENRPQPASADPLEATREAIGRSMARSKREIPHYYLGHAIDVTPALEWLAAQNEIREPVCRILLAALLVKAVALAARAHPRLNGHIDGAFRPAEAVHVGVAVALRGGGLTAPAIHDADTLTLDAVMAAMRDLAGRARAGRLRGSELADPTITVSSIGDRGAEETTAVVIPPQVAVVAFGAPQERPWVSGGAVVPRTLVRVTLSADHRISDGRIGSRFLMDLESHLAKPEDL